MPDVIEDHYRRLASNYDDFLYYSPDFVRRLTAKMVDKLRLRSTDVLVDIGCGTGMYALDILDQIALEHPVIGVDPFERMLAEIPEDANIRPVATGGLEFSRRPGSYDKILIKETVHHIDSPKEFFTNLHDRLSADGIMLLVHVPPDVEYPLFDRALQRARQWHADPAELMTRLQAAGFKVDRDELVHDHELPKDHYFSMVANRYMSVLSTFDDDELKQGLEQMEQRYADVETLRFPDRFDYLTARKSEA